MQEARTFVGDAWRQFRKHKLAMIAVVVLLIMILVGVFVRSPCSGPWIPTYIDIIAAYQDLLARASLGHGQPRPRHPGPLPARRARLAGMIGVSAMAVAITIGTVIGLASGYFRRLDNP